MTLDIVDVVSDVSRQHHVISSTWSLAEADVSDIRAIPQNRERKHWPRADMDLPFLAVVVEVIQRDARLSREV